MSCDTKSLITSTEAYCTSGTSPTTVHLVGPGQVGRALLRKLPDTALRLIGVSDRSGTVHDGSGLDPIAVAEQKESHGHLGAITESESLPIDLAIDLVDADIVIDATSSDPEHTDAAVARTRRILRRGGRIALAAKTSLAAAGERLLEAGSADAFGINAALGGTGHALLRELGRLRSRTQSVAIVGNASTTAVIEVVERGGSIVDGIRQAQRAGVLEPDPELDLSGVDAATKLAAVTRILWGRGGVSAGLPDLRELDPRTLQARFARGKTTRLVARSGRRGGFALAYEELPRSSALAVPSDRVAYAYADAASTRVHVGHGLGPNGTASALLYDVAALAANVREVRS